MTADRESLQRRSCLALAATLWIGAAPAAGQDAAGLEEVVVVAQGSQHRALQPSRALDAEAIAERAPIVAADIFRGLPSVGVRTNSRGETVVRIRGAEERQVQIFLDGAPLGVPWDGRVDLGILPAGMIGAARVTQGAAPIEYGPNAVLGVVDLTSFAPDGTGIDLAQAEVGSHGAVNASVAGGVRMNGYALAGAAGYVARDGIAASDTRVIPFAPRDGDMRFNTDMESRSLFGAGGIERPWGALRLSALSVSSSRGVAPEGHLDPTADPPRYWRYPQWRFNQVSLNADLALSQAWRLRAIGWLQDFSQQIDEFESAEYATRSASENDEDETFGARMVAAFAGTGWGARMIANAQRSTHRQLDTDFNGAAAPEEATFRQDLMSAGAEIDVSISSSTAASLSASYDYVTTPLTGGRARQEDMADWAGAMVVNWTGGPDWSVAATFGRRTRFPTMRELYGEALGDFILNPDLRPETAALGDVTLRWTPERGPLRLEVTLWATRVEGTLARRTIRVNGERFRQHYNQTGARGHGVETRLVWRWSDFIALEWAMGIQNLTSDRDSDGRRPTLYQRPEFQSSLALDLQPSEAWDFRLEADHIGAARDEGLDGQTAELPASTQFNMRAFYAPGNLSRDPKWTIYAAIENLTDALVLPQLGLPAPGRTFRLGLRWTP